jgi:hypothetical protein
MDISNSTGESTGYRIMGSGAAPCPPTAESSPLEEECVVEEVSVEEASPQAESSQEKAYGGSNTVVREGKLKPGTYVTVPILPPQAACTVEFLRNEKPFRKYRIKGKYEEILLALVPNGGGTPNALVCSKSKV